MPDLCYARAQRVARRHLRDHTDRHADGLLGRFIVYGNDIGHNDCAGVCCHVVRIEEACGEVFVRDADMP